MTSTIAAKAEIARFLSSKTPEVLAVTGAWGVGKTYTWDREIEAAQAAHELCINRYAYVSLFGLNSLDELRYALFESTVPVDQIAKGPDHTSLRSGIHWLETVGRKSLYLLKDVPYANGILNNPRNAFLAVRDQIICIDDLERAGKDLSLIDVLGLVSFLKEKRSCKIVLLLNDRKFEKADEEIFKSQLEKVVDVRINFSPTPFEAAEIGLTELGAVTEHLKAFCPRLGIKNIRVVKKLERDGNRLAEILNGFHPLVLRQALHTAALFGWIQHQPSEAPPFNFIEKYNALLFSMLNQQDKVSDEEKSWYTLLSSYEFTSVDPFDEAIIAGIREGAFDNTAITKEANELAKKIASQEKDSSFSDAWQLYHNSFQANADEVLDAIAAAFKNGVDTISPTNLSGTMSLFKELGRPEQAKELLEYYMTHRNESASFFNLHDATFGGDVTDPDVRSAFATKLDTFVDDYDPKAILLDIAVNSGWNSEDLVRLQKLSTADFKALFKDNEGVDLRRMIQTALQFKPMKDLGQEVQAISERAEEALREIGEESAINARRVAKYGIAAKPPGD